MFDDGHDQSLEVRNNTSDADVLYSAQFHTYAPIPVAAKNSHGFDGLVSRLLDALENDQVEALENGSRDGAAFFKEISKVLIDSREEAKFSSQNVSQRADYHSQGNDITPPYIPSPYGIREPPQQDKTNLSTIREERTFLPDVEEVRIIAPPPEPVSTNVANIHGEQQLVETREKTPVSVHPTQAFLSTFDVIPADKEEVQLKETKNKSFIGDENFHATNTEILHKFASRVKDFDRKLQDFDNSAGQLGSSIRIRSSIERVRRRLKLLIAIFQDNYKAILTLDLPEDILSPQQASSSRENLPQTHSVPSGATSETLFSGSRSLSESPATEELPAQMEDLSSEIMTLLGSWEDFKEFDESIVHEDICQFRDDLRYWASSLKSFTGKFDNQPVRKYIHDQASAIAEHLDAIGSSLTACMNTGTSIRRIQVSQAHTAKNLANLTTIATFFSGVTATVLQLSINTPNTHVGDASNAFLFYSLVFSTASAVNSLLASLWNQSKYSLPENRTPWFLTIWIRRSPWMFLVASITAFSIGFALYAYASNQHIVISVLTSVFTLASASGLIAVAGWFSLERWVFRHYEGSKELVDVLSALRIRGVFSTLTAYTKRRPREIVRLERPQWQHWFAFDDKGLAGVGDDSHDPVAWQSAVRDGHALLSPPLYKTLSLAREAIAHWYNSQGGNVLSTEAILDGIPQASAWLRSIVSKNDVLVDFPPFEVLGLVHLCTLSAKEIQDARNDSILRAKQAAEKRQSTLQRMYLRKHQSPLQGAVRQLDFSPHGQTLAASSSNNDCLLLDVEECELNPRKAKHTYRVSQDACRWSPDSSRLITWTDNAAIVLVAEKWTISSVIERAATVTMMSWFPASDAVLSVEEDKVTKLSLRGEELGGFRLQKMQIHHAIVTPESEHVLCVISLPSIGELRASKASAVQKRLLVYNIERKEIDDQIPLIHEISHIELARNNNVALTSYTNNDPPQLWRISFVNDEGRGPRARLWLSHTYMIPDVEYLGPSRLCGANDELVLTATKGGDIYIWHRKSSTMLYTFNYSAHHPGGEGELTCMAPNSAAQGFMFATGSSTGAITVWRVDPPEQKSNTVVVPPSQKTSKRPPRPTKRKTTRDSFVQSQATATAPSAAAVQSTSPSSAELTIPHILTETPPVPDRPTSPWSLLTPSPFHTHQSVARFEVPQGDVRLFNKSDVGLDAISHDGRLQDGDTASISSNVRSKFIRKTRRRESW